MHDVSDSTFAKETAKITEAGKQGVGQHNDGGILELGDNIYAAVKPPEWFYW